MSKLTPSPINATASGNLSRRSLVALGVMCAVSAAGSSSAQPASNSGAAAVASQGGIPKKVRLAYIEEPPFYWTAEDGTVDGSDIEVAEVVLRAIGVTTIERQKTTFGELLPGIEAGRWDMAVPIFITPERSKRVVFSNTVWALGDAVLVRRDSKQRPKSYAEIAKHADIRLGIVSGNGPGRCGSGSWRQGRPDRSVQEPAGCGGSAAEG